MRFGGRGAVVAATLAGLVAFAASPPARADEPPPVVTNHSIKVGGRTLAYTAEAGRLPIRDVTTGPSGAGNTVIASGLASGDRVVTDGTDKVTFARVPTLDEVPYPVTMEPNLVVEFYSR